MDLKVNLFVTQFKTTLKSNFSKREVMKLTSKTYDVEKHSKLTYIFFGYEAKGKKTKQK